MSQVVYWRSQKKCLCVAESSYKKIRGHQGLGQILNLGSHRHQGDHRHRRRRHRPPDLILDQQSRSVWTVRSDVLAAFDEELAEVKSGEGAVTVCV